MTPPQRVLGIVPARAGSKRLPHKNVRPLAGKPLVVRAMETALAAHRLARVCVSSDDDAVLAMAGQLPAVEALRRPAELATDNSPAIDYVQHALATFSARGEEFDAVAIIQPTSPLTLPEDVDGTIQLLLHSGAHTAVSVVRLDHAIHPVKLKTLQGDRLLPWLEHERGRMAAQDLPELYVRNCAVYVSTRAVIASGLVIGDDCRGYVMPRERSVDINEPIDFAFAEFLLQRQDRFG